MQFYMRSQAIWFNHRPADRRAGRCWATFFLANGEVAPPKAISWIWLCRGLLLTAPPAPMSRHGAESSRY